MKRLSLYLLLVCYCCCLQAARNIEWLDRGLVAVKTSSGVFLSWRVLGTDPSDIGFNLYRDGTKVNASPITTCSNYTDASGSTSSTYTVKPVINGVENSVGGTAKVWSSQSLTIKLNRPTSSNCTYSPNDCSVGDVDGDGQWEIILKWDPSNSQDNSKSGKTDKVYLDCYELDGTQRWRIDLGYNIRAGAHYTQFLVGDYDGDGKAEVVCKTAPGTKDGKGNYLSKGPAASADHSKVYRNSKGYILTGPEYLTIFNGLTGQEISTVDFNPGRGTVSSWGDSYGNRCDRFLATNAYLGNNNNPSIVYVRGYYTRMAVTAWDFNGSTLSQRWYYNAATSGKEGYGQGNHNLACGDVDNDGYDEIIHGACAIDHNGKFMYRTGLGHGDAMHFGDLNPDRNGLEVFCVHEEKSAAYGYEYHDARTGTIIGGAKTGTDNGRGMAADIDASSKGYEAWSGGNGNVIKCDGSEGGTRNGLSQNFRLYWDGDLQDELMDGGYTEDLTITKWISNNKVNTIYTLPGKSCNTTKRTPNLSADILGDWREEVISHNGADEIYITTTVIPTTYKMYTLMHDPIYRNAISWQNTAYNQPPHLGIWLGSGKFPTPDINLVGGGQEVVVLPPTLTKNGTGGSSQTVAIGTNITDFSFVWANASTVKISWAPFVPEGLTVKIDDANKRISFSGASSVGGKYTYTITTVSGYETEASKTGTLTFGDGTYPKATLQKCGGGSSKQSVPLDSAIYNFYYKWNYAETVSVTWEPSTPEGINVDIDNDSKEVHFSGGVTNASACNQTFNFRVTTVGNPSGLDSTKTGRITITKTSHVFECSATNGDWDATTYWNDQVVPTDCDTAFLRTGEANITSDVRALTYVETNGTFRIRDNVAVREVHFVGGQLKSYTSNPEFRLTASALYFDKDTKVTAGSVEASVFKINGTIMGAGNITKVGVGTLYLNASASELTGKWLQTEGTLQVAKADALGKTGVEVSNAAKLQIDAANTTGSLTMATGTTAVLNADLTVSHATLGDKKLPAGTYTASDYPNFLSGSAKLIVTVGESVTLSEEIAAEQAVFAVAPNPASTEVTVYFNATNVCEYTIQIINLTGSVVDEVAGVAAEGQNEVVLGISDLGSGVYIIRATIEAETENMRVIVE